MAGEDRKLEQLRNSYRNHYKNYSLQFTLGLIWLFSAYIGKFDIQFSILALFIGISLLKPAIYFITRFLQVRNIHKDESLTHLTKITVIGILFGMIIGFFPFVENINYFFPAFAILFGLIFACIAYTSRMINYAFLAAILIIGSLYLGYNYEEDFTHGGFFSGIALVSFGIMNGIAGKRARIIFQLTKRKAKSRWKATLLHQANQTLVLPAKKRTRVSVPR